MVLLAVESASLGRLSSSSASSEAGSSADWPETVRVAVRVRPPLAREVSTEELTVRVPGEVTAWPDDGLGPGPRYSFTFDAAFSPSEGQAAVYDAVARPAVSSTLAGFNASIIAYGHTGAGKTYTMEGLPDGAQRGIIPRAVADIFEHVERSARPGARRFLVRASYLQIYNEALSDLLKPGRNGLVIREDRKKGLRADGLSEWVVRSPAEVDGLLRRGAETRATAATAANDASSRSHAVFCLTFEQSEASGGGGEAYPRGSTCPRGSSVFRSSKLNLVDLAGSERLRVSGASGQRLEECKYINGSLAALGNVVAALTSGTARHVPYRDSKLTRLLADSLGGNCKTTMIACVAAASMAETVSTLKFASRARHVHNSARINEQIDQRTKLQSLEGELTRLRAVLVEREQSVGDSRRFVQAEAERQQAFAERERAEAQVERAEAERRRAEAERLSALRQLEARSREVLQEKAANALLAEQIARMEDEHEALVEGEGEAAGQVDEMAETVAELQRIVAERDAALARLREEATARQRRLSELEDALDRKTAQLIHTQRLQVERREAAAEAAAEAATPLASEGADDGAAAKPLGRRSLSRCSSDGSSGAGTGLAALAPAHCHSSDASSGTGGTGSGTGTTPLARRSLAAVGPTGTPLELTEPQEGWGGISETSRRLEVELEAAQRQLQAASETAASAEEEVETMRAGLAAAHDAAAVQGEALRVEREKAAAAREAQQRERAVLVSLLECKVSRLLAHVSHDLEPPVDEARRQRASQEVQALRRLVAAAVVALKMPDG